MTHILLILVLFAAMLTSCGDGLTEKVMSTFDNGRPSKSYFYDRDGRWVREVDYHENGMVMMEGPVENDLRNGEWTSYFPDGKVQSSGEF